MNPHTGELAMLRDGEERDGFERVPTGRLDAMARQKMNRFAAAMARAGTVAVDPMAAPRVNLRSHTPLAQWARRKRPKKIAAASRRRNRRKGG